MRFFIERSEKRGCWDIYDREGLQEGDFPPVVFSLLDRDMDRVIEALLMLLNKKP